MKLQVKSVQSETHMGVPIVRLNLHSAARAKYQANVPAVHIQCTIPVELIGPIAAGDEVDFAVALKPVPTIVA